MNQFIYFVSLILLRVFIATGSAEGASGNNSTETGASNSKRPNPDAACPSNRCLQKCCQPHKMYDWTYNRCVDDVNHLMQNSDSSELFAKFDVTIMPDFWCPHLIGLLDGTREETEYELYSNGSIFVEGIPVLNFRQYCVDYLTQDNFSLVYCFDDDFIPTSLWPITYKSIPSYGYILSSLFLIITLGLYLATSKLRKKVHCKCFLFHTFSLIVGFCSLLVAENTHVENPVCALSGHMIHFWILASFFWLNVMSFDMWRSIGNTGMRKESNVWKLFIYCLYAWGCPCLIFIITLLADNFLDLPSNSPWRPGFAEKNCWFREKLGNDGWLYPEYVYYYGISSITLVVNMILFVDTAKKIRNQNNTWKQCENADSKRHQSENIRFILYLRLLLIMGLDWVMDLLSFHFDDRTYTFWFIITCMNSFRGVFVFIIFVCNKRILMILKERFFAKNQC